MTGRGRRAVALTATALAVLPVAVRSADRPAGAVATRETRAAPDVEPVAFAVVDYLSGGAVRASGLVVPPPSAVSTEPPWLPNWRQSLQAAAQPSRAARDLTFHPLGRLAPAVVQWSDTPSVDPASPATAAWSDLACPPAASQTRPPPVVFTQVALLGENAHGWPTLGVQLACVAKQSRLLAIARAVVHTDTNGRVQSAQVVRWVGDRRLPPPTGPEAQPDWPIRPAQLQSRKPAWVLPGGYGWLVQVQHDAAADWQDDGVSLPTAQPQSDPAAPRRRALWSFDRVGRLRQVLLAVGDRERQPPDGDGAGEFEAIELPGLFVLQRLAVADGAHAGSRAGYAAWHLPGEAAHGWRVDLPELPTAGLWHCLGHGQPLSLHCQFASLGDTAAPRQAEDLVLLADPAQRAFLRPRVRR